MKHSSNRVLWPLKAYYFLTSAAAATIYPYKAVFAKGIGLTSKHVAVSYGVVQILTIINNPLIGFITDKYKNYKIILIILLTIQSIFTLSLNFLPPIKLNDNEDKSKIICNNSGLYTNDKIMSEVAAICSFDSNETVTVQCLFFCNIANSIEHLEQEHKMYENITGEVTFIGQEHFFYKSDIQIIGNNLSLSTIRDNVFCNNIVELHCILHQCTENLCFPHNNTKQMDIEWKGFTFSYQFWLFLFFSILHSLAGNSASSLGDTICVEKLEDKSEKYGQQRLMSSVAWGIFTMLFGLAFDLYSEGQSRINYAVGFYSNTGINIICGVMIWVYFTESYSLKSKHISKDVWGIFHNPEVILFAFVTCIGGAYDAFIQTFLYWHLDNLHASRLNMGLCTLLMCLSEIPIFFFYGFIFRILGHGISIAVVFVAMAIRMFFYSIIKNAWIFLPVELLHGITFALCHGTIISYGQSISSPGTIATILEIFGGFFKGIGGFIGTFIAGLIFSSFGARQTFRIIGTFTAILSCSFLICHMVLRKKNMTFKLNKLEPEDGSPQLQPLSSDDIEL